MPSFKEFTNIINLYSVAEKISITSSNKTIQCHQVNNTLSKNHHLSTKSFLKVYLFFYFTTCNC